MITEIREKDFRKLNIRVWIYNIETRTYERVKLNDVLDKDIKCALESGTMEDEKDLNTPVTIALHIDNDKKKWNEGGYYLDKFMNSYTGARTFQIGFGINHLYTSRDYYHCKEDYWQVRKDETDIIYRVYLEPKKFVLKYKTVVDADSCRYDEEGNYHYTTTSYKRENENEPWVECGGSEVTERKGSYTTIKNKKVDD